MHRRTWLSALALSGISPHVWSQRSPSGPSTVVLPLYTNYKCTNYGGGYGGYAMCAMLMYVSGREVVHYRKDGKEGTFEIDYGNGECDTIITIIEEGKVIDVDQPTIMSLAAKTM